MKYEAWRMSSLKDEAAYRPHHTCRAADRDGPRRLKWGGSKGITQTERGTCWWKLILKWWYWLWGAEKDVHVCEMNTDLSVLLNCAPRVTSRPNGSLFTGSTLWSFVTELLLTRCSYFFGLVTLLLININTHNSYWHRPLIGMSQTIVSYDVFVS